MPFVALCLWVYSKAGKYLTYLSYLLQIIYIDLAFTLEIEIGNSFLFSLSGYYMISIVILHNINRSVAFEPSLPEEKEKAIQNLGIGVVNKVVLVFDDVFWDNVDYIGK